MEAVDSLDNLHALISMDFVHWVPACYSGNVHGLTEQRPGYSGHCPVYHRVHRYCPLIPWTMCKWTPWTLSMDTVHSVSWLKIFLEIYILTWNFHSCIHLSKILVIWIILFVCLYDFLFNVPVNNFSVMLRRSHLFLGITSTFGEWMSLAQGNNTPTRPRIEPGSPDLESDALTTRPVRPRIILFRSIIYYFQ